MGATCAFPALSRILLLYGLHSVQAALVNAGLPCWIRCSGQGACDSFCGVGGACCQLGGTESPASCAGGLRGCVDKYCCVDAAGTPPPPPPSPHAGEACFSACGRAGNCRRFCGAHGACCKWDADKGLADCGHGSLGCTYAHCCTPRPPLRTATTACADPLSRAAGSSPTVAYGFMTRSSLPLWDVWETYFRGCRTGTALPIVHSQASADDAALRRALSRQVGRYGGLVLPASATREGSTRFSWRMVSIMLSLMRVAAAAQGGSGCRPRWIHFLSERDAPIRSCAEVHAHLASKRGASLLDQTNQGNAINGGWV